ncbi:MAG: hypothetical protein HYT88_05310 [Candidatus Omnitrophica bacterium]|nr:hypothetical protein [Candidatus Omnitrophota bacterium]MBI3010784.1 hypothetical protein [Candidatus Omnitrophota bacterium]
MRGTVLVWTLVLGLCGIAYGEGRENLGKVRERSIEELPKDVFAISMAWTQPIKQVVTESRRFDPISGVWFGLLRGSLASIERTATMFLPADKEHPGTELKGGKALLRYTF